MIDNAFWVEANENGHTEAARFMTGMIWLMWLLNQYFVLIFSFNFMVSIIGQGYEESLDQVTVQKYTFRCERVMEASILTKMAGAARTLQTFSLSTNNNASIGDWPGFVQSIKTYVREENIVIRQSLTDNVVELHKKIDSKTLSLENQIKDLSKKMTHVNDGITEKLDNLAERFGEIKDALAVSEEGSNFMGEVEDVDGEGAGDQDGGIKLNDIDISQAN